MSSVTNSLNDLFQKHRLVFWYDPDKEMRAEFDAYEAEDLEKIEVNNNEFGLKYRMAREAPKSRFLIYMPHPRPAHAQNWLLDLELAHHVFQADQTSLVLQDIGFQEEHRPFVERYRDFFRNKERKERLKERLHAEDSEREWQLKMLAVLAREEPILENILWSLFAEIFEERTEKWRAIEKYGLDEFFWKEVSRTYDYRADQPTLTDLALEIFIAAAPCGRTPKLGREARVMLSRWKDSQRYRKVFAVLSKRFEDDLNISGALNTIEGIAQIQDQDAFEAIEKKIIVELRDGLLEGRLSVESIRSTVDRREGSYWFDRYQPIYSSVLAAARLFESLRTLDLSFSSASQAIIQYAESHYLIDQLYRDYLFNARISQQATLLHAISQEVEQRYTNEFLLRLNDRFQGYLDTEDRWPIGDSPRQRDFFERQVLPVLNKGNKLFVIISDALRYEAGEALHKRIQREDRFRSSLGFQVSTLPSYTQLGMAALLPHDKLEVVPSSGQVLADGESTQGLEARKAILGKSKYRATALKADEFLRLNAKEEGRALTRDHDLIYIFQNGIDQTGDKRETEHEVFDAVEREFKTVTDLLKKVSAVNGNNVLITADHGFLFRSAVLEESDFTERPAGNNVGIVNRRFLVGESFQPASGAKIFSAEQLGLAGEAHFAIPKSINRFRVKGAGSRFVHGGASLQEIVLPVLTVNKARKTDTAQVEVDVIRGTSNLITTSKATISFYQQAPAEDKQLGRTLQIGFYGDSGEAISDQHTVTFDQTESDPRAREKKISFTFRKSADQFNNKEIYLRLEERIRGSNQFRIYKELAYRFRKPFESDFEF